MIDEIDAALIDKKCRFDTDWHVLGLTACTRADHSQRELFYLEKILEAKLALILDLLALPFELAALRLHTVQLAKLRKLTHQLDRRSCFSPGDNLLALLEQQGCSNKK